MAGDSTRWEAEPLGGLARRGSLAVHQHPGFWQAMVILRDKVNPGELWGAGGVPWKTW